MHCLDKAVSQIVESGAGPGVDRKKAVAGLESAIAQCDDAIKLWQEYLKSPGAAGDKRSILSWVGPERAKRLHEIGLEAGRQMMQACVAIDSRAGHTMALEDSVIESAYRQLKDGETGQDAAKSAISRMQQRVQHLRELMTRVNAARSAPAASKRSAAAKKPAKKKSPTTTRPVTKAAARKKPAAKKRPAAKKKAPAKPRQGKKKVKRK